MKKKAIAFFMCVVICVTVAVPASAVSRDTSFEAGLAADLRELGLFRGVSDTDFDLDRAPSRAEALVMLIRLLGRENEALSGTWEHPFTDVPDWADKYVGFAYENGLTNGVSETQFGSGTANAGMYLTFVLRALGYSDAGGADFTWSSPYSLAKGVGILPGCVDTVNFWRADAVTVSYAALAASLKGTARTLAQKLIASGAFTQTQYEACYDGAAISSHTGASSETQTELTSEEIYARCAPSVFYIEVYNSKGTATASGSGFFIDSAGTAVTNYHVIDGASSAKITASDTGRIYDVTGVYDYDAEEDWAVIKVAGSGFSYLDVGAAKTIVGGAKVYAIGSPLGLQNTITEGLISNPARVEGSVTYIQTSAAISSGSSGGALINKYGDVVGITSASYLEGQNLNLAVPMSYVNLKAASNACMSLSSLVSAGANASPAQYLEDYLVAHGKSSALSGGVYSIDMTDSTGGCSFSIMYTPLTGELCLSETCDSISTMLYLSGGNAADSGNKVVFVYRTTSSYQSGVGTVQPSSFAKYSDFSFYSWLGNTGVSKSYCEELCGYMLLDTLNAAEYIFDYYGMQVSMSDFGFTAA